MKNPPVMLPVVDIGLFAKAAKLAATLALPYVAASPVSCEPLPMKNPPAMLAVVVILAALTNALTTLPLRLRPAAFRLPPAMLPVTPSEVNVPTLVIFGCAAVLKVPAIPVALILPPAMLPVAPILPDATMPTVLTFPVADSVAP